MSTDANSRSGFSLLEVMLAVLVLGISMSVFFSAAGQGAGTAARALNYQLARELLDQLELREPLDLQNLEPGRLTGSFSHSQAGKVDWTRELAWEGREEDGFFRLQTRVEWGETEDRHSESMETFVYPATAMRGGWVQEPLDEW